MRKRVTAVRRIQAKARPKGTKATRVDLDSTIIGLLKNWGNYFAAIITASFITSSIYQLGIFYSLHVNFAQVPIDIVDITKSAFNWFGILILCFMANFVIMIVFSALIKIAPIKFLSVFRNADDDFLDGANNVLAAFSVLFCIVLWQISIFRNGINNEIRSAFTGVAFSFTSTFISVNYLLHKSRPGVHKYIAIAVLFFTIQASAFNTAVNYGDVKLKGVSPELIVLSDGTRIEANIISTYQKGILVAKNGFVIFIKWENIKAVNYGTQKSGSNAGRPWTKVTGLELW
jgi:hypothetical protein